MKTNKKPNLTNLWASVFGTSILLPSLHYPLAIKWTFFAVLVAAAAICSWAELTGAGPKLSGRKLMVFKIVGLVVAPLLAYGLYVLLKPFHTQ